MTGDEHYRIAESILKEAKGGLFPNRIALAQVHATLALASATAIAGSNSVDGPIHGFGNAVAE